MDEKTKKYLLIAVGLTLAGAVAWGIIVVAATVGTLQVLSTQISSGESCSFDQPGLICNSPAPPILSSGTLKGRIVNGYGKSIYITGIACSADRNLDLASGGFAAVSLPSAVSPQGSYEFSSVSCTGAGGAGTDYRGILYVKYYFSDDDPKNLRLGKANLMTRSQ